MKLLMLNYFQVFDRRLGRHLVSLYYKTQRDSNEELVEMSVLRDYLAYAKQTFNPKLSDEAGTLLTQSYVRMRQVGSGRGQITAYPRYFFFWHLSIFILFIYPFSNVTFLSFLFQLSKEHSSLKRVFDGLTFHRFFRLIFRLTSADWRKLKKVTKN